MMNTLLEVLGAVLVAVGVGLFDVRLALIAAGAYLVYAVRDAE